MSRTSNQWELEKTLEASSGSADESGSGEQRWSLPDGTVVASRYRIVRELGRGGMGAVFEAFDVNLERVVAIKFLDPELTKSDESIQRFQLEAIAAGRIGHENICDVRDRGETDEGMPFIVMEMLDGEELAELECRLGRLPPGRAVEIVLQVLAALEAAHDKGIVHRDLKPENIFLTSDSNGRLRTKILDFGVSRFLDESASIRLTRTGNVLGTPCYMSPEQARGMQDLDQRCDIWAVGVILFEALTGQLPFNGENYNEMIAKILMEDPLEPGMIVPSLSESLEAVVMRALEKDPDDRFSSAHEFAEQLRGALEHPDLLDWCASLARESADSGYSSGEVTAPKSSSIGGRDWEDDSLGMSIARQKTASDAEEPERDEASRPAPSEAAKLARKSRGPAAAVFVAVGVVLAVGTGWVFINGSNADIEDLNQTVTAAAESSPPFPAGEASSNEDHSASGTTAVAAVEGGEQQTSKVAHPPSTDVIELRVRVNPESGRLKIDGVELEGNPWVGTFPRDGVQHHIEASARGYKRLARFVPFDQDREVELNLERERDKRPRPGPKARPSSHSKARFDHDNPYGSR